VGVSVTDLAAPEIVECDIYGHTLDGLVIAGGADPKVLKNKIRSDSNSPCLEYFSATFYFLHFSRWSRKLHTTTVKAEEANGYPETALLFKSTTSLGQDLLMHAPLPMRGGQRAFASPLSTFLLIDIHVFSPSSRPDAIYRRGCKTSGILVRHGGMGLVEGNEISGHSIAGVIVHDAGSPQVTLSR
jgi:hypothetical protein